MPQRSRKGSTRNGGIGVIKRFWTGSSQMLKVVDLSRIIWKWFYKRIVKASIHILMMLIERR